ncbi:MAG: hypothetical protein ABI791_06185 [Acidobacteriota bacterium]
MKRFVVFTAVILFFALDAYAQNGGKAEPKRISFAPGAVETVLRGSLENGEEMEYVFAARKGQSVTVRNSVNSMFDVRVFSSEFGVETEFESSREFSVVVPEAGDYMLFVRKKMTRNPARSRFAVAIRIH